MRNILFILWGLIHLFVKFIGRSGLKKVAAENLALRHQLLVLRMLNEIIGGVSALPRFLSSDNDPLFRYQRWRANLRLLGIEEIKSIPYVPTSAPFIERLIGTIRREFLDHVFFLNERDLKRKLLGFADYYNRYRVHYSLEGQTPHQASDNGSKKFANIADYRWLNHCGALFQTPIAA